jgi:hypothetical protein
MPDHSQNAHSAKSQTDFDVVIVGAGPGGLMAAEALAAKGYRIAVFDAMPSAGRKLLQAGRGGLNLTHSEPKADFMQRYGEASQQIALWLAQFDADDLRAWAAGLGVETFVGSSGRVYPVSMQAAPLLRHWLQRLKAAGARFAMRHRWVGWNDDDALLFESAGEQVAVHARAVVLALGGASWPRLGSNGQWQALLESRGIQVNTFQPSNCGFNLQWSPVFQDRFAGEPLKNVLFAFTDHCGQRWQKQGEAMLTQYGIEGSAVYALSAPLRDTLVANGAVTLYADLLPYKDSDELVKRLAKPRGKQSLSSHFKRCGLSALQIGLLREVLTAENLQDAQQVVNTLKHYPLHLSSSRPIEEAISTAGGIALSEMDDALMLRKLPGVFAVGEMLDWEAPTGGYLLTAVMASAKVAADGVDALLKSAQAH